MLQLECLSDLIVDLYHLKVLLFVGLVPLIVFKDIFDHGDCDDEGEGHQHDWLASRYRDVGDHLHEGDQQEVHIRQLGELLQEVLGQEGQEGVLRGLHLVVSVAAGVAQVLLVVLVRIRVHHHLTD